MMVCWNAGPGRSGYALMKRAPDSGNKIFWKVPKFTGRFKRRDVPGSRIFWNRQD
jgi:hypothetical protein